MPYDFNLPYNSSLIPDVDNTSDLGSPDKYIRRLYTHGVSATGITVSGSGIISGDFAIGGTLSGPTIDGKKPFHGVQGRVIGPTNPLPSGLSSSTFTLSGSMTPLIYWYSGVKVSINTDKTCIVPSGLSLIKINGLTGDIYASQTGPGFTYSSDVYIATVLFNGSNLGVVFDERHQYDRDLRWHEWAHHTIGVRYHDGLDFTHNGGTGAGATFNITDGSIFDEDIEFMIAQRTTARIFYPISTTDLNFDAALSTAPFRLGTGGRPQMIDPSTFTLTTLSSAPNRYINAFMYATDSLVCPIWILVETPSASVFATNGYTSLANARLAGFPNLAQYNIGPEMKPIWRVVIRADGVVQAIDYVSDDFRNQSSVAGGGGTSTVTANSVLFSPYSDISSTNVQGAIQELADDRVKKFGDIMSGILTFSNSGYLMNILSANPSWQEGRVFYDNTDHTLAYYNDVNGITVNVGQEQLARVRNNTASTILNGQPVYVNGALGDRPTVQLASASGTINVARILGIATDDITAGADGYITVGGLVHNFPYSNIGLGVAPTVGSTLFVGGASGTLTTTQPAYPAYRMLVGTVTKVSGGNIEVYVDKESYPQIVLDGANTLLGMDATGINQEYKTITGISNITINNTPGNIIFSGLPTKNLTTSNPEVTITNGINSVVNNNITLNIAYASNTTSGLLRKQDWQTFNAKQATITTSLPLVKTGANLTIRQASATESGFLTKADWDYFNRKLDNGINIGSGSGLITGIDSSKRLAIKSLIPGSNITFNVTPTDITINSTGGGATLSGSNVSYAYNEIPAGVINSSNRTYTILQPPINNSLQLFWNGNLLNLSGLGAGTFDYTLSGTTITTISTPQIGDSLVANYQYTSPSGLGIYATYTGIRGPVSSTIGNIPVWNSTDGYQLNSSSFSISGNNLVPINSGVQNIGAPDKYIATGYFNNIPGPLTCKAWMTANVNSTTITSISGYNIKQLTTPNVGLYSVQFINPINGPYSLVGSAGQSSDSMRSFHVRSQSPGSGIFYTAASDGSLQYVNGIINIQVFGF